MRMARRSTQIHGMVNFPVNTESSNEGGMFVRLWAIPRKNGGLCCGTETTELVDATFLGTDTTKKLQEKHAALLVIKWAKPITNVKDVERLDKLERKLNGKVFDQFLYEDEQKRRWSCGLVASVLMGSTGWSNGNFICTYQDLNETGKQFYDLFKSQYPHCDLHLLTFLDT